MIEEEVRIPMPDGSCDAVLIRSDDAPNRPGVIHLADIRGVRPANRGMAARLASEGYTVLLPNVFYRTGRPPVFDFPLAMGDERSMKRMAELTGPLTPDAVERDAESYVGFLAGLDSVGPGSIGVVGFCFTGGLALRIAAARPDKVAAMASFHGGNLYTAAADSPHRLLPRVRARLYFGHAFEDRSMPEEAIRGLESELEAWGGRFESEVYQGARHGWTVPDSAAYNEPEAERAFGRLKELLAETL